MQSSHRTAVRWVAAVALALGAAACETPAASADHGGRPVTVLLTTWDQDQLGRGGAVEASAGDRTSLAAAIYLFDEYQWSRFEAKGLFAEVQALVATGEAERATKRRKELQAALAPRRVEGARTPHTVLIQPQPHVFAAVRGNQVAYQVFDAMHARHVAIQFD